MKIALPVTSFLPNLGGMEVGVHNLAKNLLSLGHEPIVITSYSIFRKLKKKKISLPYKVIFFYPFILSIFNINHKLGFFLSEKYLRVLQRIYNFDFWHITMAFPLGVMFINYAKKSNFSNFLIRAVGEDIQYNKELKYGYSLIDKNKKLMKIFLPQCNNFVSISESISRVYRSLGISNKSIHHIPNGVSINRFKPLSLKKKNQLKKKYKIKNKLPIFITLGRNHPKKKFDFILKLANRMSLGKKQFKFLIVGQGVAKLQEKVNLYNISEHIILIDTSNEIYDEINDFPPFKIIEYLSISDFFVFPSILESFGVVLIEAMAAGLPTIANNVPGCRDIILDNKTGFLSKKNNDINTYLEKINLLMNNISLVRKMKKRCFVESRKYDWEKICKEYLKLYKMILVNNLNS
jgi:glycosyltransferase involved in cell wall biosynthesis